MSSPLAGPSNQSLPSRSISGTIPGILDPSQPARLLRLLTSTLSFASFDPHTAHVDGTRGFPNLSQNSPDEQHEHYRPKRIVIETTPNGESFWRFVPRARKEDSVGTWDEGSWPRVVEICGERVLCTQDQWDIYKLDLEYDCFIQSSPKLSIISRVKSKPTTNAVPPETPSGKRRSLSPQLVPNVHKKSRQRSLSVSSGVSSAEGDMSIDEGAQIRSKSAGFGRRAKIKERHEQSRRERREKIIRFQAKRNHQDDNNMLSPSEDVPTTPKPRFQSMPSENTGKRKVGSTLDRSAHTQQRSHPDIEENDGEQHDEPFNFGPANKRTRTTSPRSAKRTMKGKRAEREKGKQKRWEEIMRNRKVDRDRRFMNDILKEVSGFKSTTNARYDEQTTDSRNQSGYQNDENDENRVHGHWPEVPEEANTKEERLSDEENIRRSAIAESIRKLQELEKDKPLWDEAAKKRMQRETAEEDERRAKAEARRRAAAWQTEIERRAKAEKGAQEARARAEIERQEREAAAKCTREKKREERQRWESGPWTISRALDRYKAICETFDNTQFSPNKPLMFEDVPWPVLYAPQSFNVEDVDWSAVERFFEAVKPYVRGDDYGSFVEKSHRRFHPDRWRSRRLLTSIIDDGDRECLEVAANTVAQALTPLWRHMKDL